MHEVHALAHSESERSSLVQQFRVTEVKIAQFGKTHIGTTDPLHPQSRPRNRSATWPSGSPTSSPAARTRHLCASPPADVRGKVVVYSRAQATCSVETAYANMLRVGAAAMVVAEPWAPPGVFCYRHSGWNAAEFASAPMTIATVAHLPLCFLFVKVLDFGFPDLRPLASA